MGKDAANVFADLLRNFELNVAHGYGLKIRQDILLKAIGPPVSAHVFHLDPNAVYRYVGLVQYTAGWLWRHVDHEASVAVPGLERLDDVAVRRQPFAVWRNVDHRRLDLVVVSRGWWKLVEAA